MIGSKKKTENLQYTRMTGCPIAHNKNSLTAGLHGPVLLQDDLLLEKITQFTREKIPARNVHALGCGAHGTFTVTHDISKYTKANLFSKVGEKFDVFVRFSGIFTEQGEADTVRDPRGFAIKFYTKEGNWDLLGINTPVFNLRDAKIGPDAIHAFKRDPRTGEWNPLQSWDFIVNHPESLHQVLMLYSDRGGTPMSYRHMHGYGCNTFSFINSQGNRFWVKFHILSPLGAKGLTVSQAKIIAGEDPNFLSRDLREAIERKDFPKWRFCCQIMPEEEGYQNDFAFDPTKVWKHKDYPLIDVGELELNRNPVDYFSEVEQVAFSPLNVVPGISYSPDKLLQGRLLIYDDAQHHRIGPNFKQLEINKPRGIEINNNCALGGNMQLDTRNKFPHYYPSNFGGPQPNQKYLDPPLRCDGPADFYDYPNEGTDEDYYRQPSDFVKLLSEKDRENLCLNIAISLGKASDEDLVNQVISHLCKIDQTFGKRVEKLVNRRNESLENKTESERMVSQLIETLKGKQVSG